MGSEKYNSFWSIIEDNRIEIPTIQRDYTYGRKSATKIREKLVGDIIDNLLAKKTHNLDFIYGKLSGKENLISQERNKSNIQSLLKTIKLYASDLNLEISDEVVTQDVRLQSKINFIPLDGQQRLTTLYLIHWYIAQRNKDENSLNSLNKFTYSTRISSKEFCKILSGQLFKFNDETIILSDIICNNEHFFSSWRKDPTVNSMLVVIDEIHKVFKTKKTNYIECWKHLTKTSFITFDFFDLDDFELTDDLYIKMNARGRQLTSFEIFKSWVIKEKGDIIDIEHWKTNLDIRWYDLFWQVKEKSNYKVDSEFLQYFKILFLGDYMKFQNQDDSRMDDDSELENYYAETLNVEDFKSVIAVLRTKDSKPLEIFQSQPLFETKLNDYLELLDLSRFILDTNTELLLNKYIETDLSKFLFGEKLHKLNWWDTTFHYAITRYILEVRTSNEFFNEWTRVISNLIYNTKIDTPKLFILAIKSIDALIEKIKTKSVYEVFCNLVEDEILFFSPNQKKEEILKSKLIHKDSSLEEEFIRAENHNYFYGQIGFIFKLTKEPVDLKKFKEISLKVESLFSEEVLKEETYLLTRSLLACGDCFYKNGKDRIFNSNARGTLRNRTENWRKFFEAKLSFIETLIQNPDFDTTNIVKSLNTIIQSELPNWKNKYFGKFVENYKLFHYAKKNVIRQIDKNYYLLNSTRISGYFVELYTYSWFLKNEKGCSQIPEYKISYDYVKGQDNEPGVKFKKGKSLLILKRDLSSRKYYVNKGKERLEYQSISSFINSLK